ncbi:MULTISPECIES: hypothetical protein [unclassified Variovorax]|uniref:hypothetical protein n=1 Tax=unclassified Variovorax TaxID=663243 RepID=UPI003ED17062
MTYIQRKLRDLPAHRGLLQDLACTPLTEKQLTEKYGFVFEEVSDALSMTQACFVGTASGRLFVIVCRRGIPEWVNTIRTERSDEPLASYVPQMLAEFCESTGFAAGDLERIWADGV